MSRDKGRNWIPWAWAIVLFVACGGSVVESSGDDDGGAGEAGRAGAAGASAVGGRSGASGSNPGGRGGFSGASGASGVSGASGIAGVAGRAGSAGYGGGAGYGGSGPICIDQGCGPSGSRCCSEGSGCGSGGPNGIYYSCSCYGGVWSCTDNGSGDGTCPPGACASAGLTCCRGRCVNTQNDPNNCGGCGSVCANRFCSFGSCAFARPCYVTSPIDASGLCCGQQICGSSAELCCYNQVGGTQGELFCHTPSPREPSCPVGCPNCF